MCGTCGCGTNEIPRVAHHHPQGEDHAHPRRHDVSASAHKHRTAAAGAALADHAPASGGSSRLIQVEQALLAENDRHATHNRALLNRKHTRAFNFISSPGAGKTTLLEKTLTALRARSVGCAVIEGDQKTDLDAQRIARTGVSVVQIETGRSCHLDAEQVHLALHRLDVPQGGLLFIENVGNLICPTEFKLGEHERLTILSVAEGHDKPAKYPLAFRNATVVVISKMDLLPYVDFDLVEARRLITGLNPKAPIFELSATTGDGMDEWFSWLQHRMPAAAREEMA